MNIPLQALLIVLMLLPGFMFNQSYFKVENHNLKFVPFSNKTIVAIIVALIAHIISLFFLVHFIDNNLDPKKYLKLILYLTHENSNNNFLISNKEIIWTIIYLVVISFLAYFIGFLGRLCITYFKLDKFKCLRFDNDWYYFLKGYDFPKEPSFVEIVAAVKLGGEVYLYKGFLINFILDGKGQLDRLIISNASRRKVTEDEEDKFYDIEGSFFVLKNSEIINLNVYFAVLEASDVAQQS